MTKRDYALLAVLLLAGAYVGGNDYLDEQYVVQEKQKAEAKKAALFASLIAQCLNGALLRVGSEPVVECKQIKGKR